MARETRRAILTAAAELMRSRGYSAVGMKEIAAAAGAPIGSLYHHFSGGKVEIAAEALQNAGAAYDLLIPTIAQQYDDLGEALEGMFMQAAEDMESSGFMNMCPVGSVAAEVADTVEELRQATGGVFISWVEGGTAYFSARGLAPDQARAITVTLICALEGAFTVARTLRSTEPLVSVGQVLGRQYRGVALTPLCVVQPQP